MEPIKYTVDGYLKELQAMESWLRSHLYGHCRECKELKPISELQVCVQPEDIPKVYSMKPEGETITMTLKTVLWLQCTKDCSGEESPSA